MGRRGNFRGVLDAPETIYARAKTAGWLLRASEQNVEWDSSFFECLAWVIGDIRPLLQRVMHDTQKLAGKKGIALAKKSIKEDIKGRHYSSTRNLENIYLEHSCLEGIIAGAVEHFCTVAQQSYGTAAALYHRALRRLQQTFGLNKECLAVCEFVFICQIFSAVEDYLEEKLHIHKYGNRRILAHMLAMKPLVLQSSLAELLRCGVLEPEYKNLFRLKESLLQFWEPGPPNTNELFSRPLGREALPLSSFHVPQEDIAHAKKLLEQSNNNAVHILLYGPPGTGKSTFARSLARACNVKAWSAVSREEDDDADRRASLTASLHLARKHRGAFVLVDEAERLLDTNMAFGHRTKDKAWLNEFLERPGQRVVWITNHIGHIDPAVRRRFSFSIHFEKLGNTERTAIWRQILHANRLATRLDSEQITALVKNYPVEAAVIQSAVVQAKKLYKGKLPFYNALETVLRAQVMLQHNGVKQRVKPQVAPAYTLEGVCIEGSAPDLLQKCRRVDAAMRAQPSITPGCGTMLFYGPPGTGKTALARYIAQELGRECMVKRASDLLSPYVGVAEQQVAEAFREAEAENAVLVIDEADSFLYSRDVATRTWETSLVNEFLTALEECRGFCICTTNMRGNLDAAAMRRFSHKVAFTYAGQEQVHALYANMLAPLCGGPASPQLLARLGTLRRLTPGDFHAVRAQYNSLFADATNVSHEALVDALTKEQGLKVEARAIGFSG